VIFFGIARGGREAYLLFAIAHELVSKASSVLDFLFLLVQAGAQRKSSFLYGNKRKKMKKS
jgi:hypothetical protein